MNFTIYNRWGQVVFTTKDISRGWDGTFGGQQQDTNVFAWMCTYQLEGEGVNRERGSVFDFVVADDDPRQAWDDSFRSGDVRRMREVGVAGGGTFKEHDKAVGETFAQPFGARIHAPGQVEDAGDLPRQGLDDPPHVGDIVGRGGFFELKEGDVFDAIHGGVRSGQLRSPSRPWEGTRHTSCR